VLVAIRSARHNRGGCIYNGGGRSCPLNNILQGVCVYGGHNRVVDRGDKQPHIGHEFSRFNRSRVGHEDNVLVPHLEIGCQEIARRIAQIKIKYDGDNGAAELRTIHPEQFRDLARLAAV